jgi:multicomponent Na+:H+ antiporter subunit E
MGHVIYANSITLTPGTITVTLENGDMMIHALTREAADGLLTGDMDRRVTAIEGVGALDRLLAVKAASKGDAP